MENVQKLKTSELRYRRLFEATQDGILLLNAETGMIEDVNPYLINALGYSRDEFIQKKLWEVGAFRDVESCQDALETLQKNEHIRYEDLPLRAKNGQLMHVEFVSSVYMVGNEKVIQCNIRDITERKQAQDELRKSEALLRELAIRDYLTGLFNRRYMEETLERELLRAARKQISLGIIMLDVDDFKQFNDLYGHALGDSILCELGKLLLTHVRGEDVACRYGGDEFLDAITLSLCVAVFPEDGSDSAAILRAADNALYSAKRQGRGRVGVAGQESIALDTPQFTESSGKQ
jgi:PAS domain S-box-containing protein